ncbi:MAG: NUDIX hydrolase [Clostridia bacterium]|jgi:8-oxo-dGTP diphosphatase|nr:NUDIX hydrolase [Clostridia bacterium]
MQVVAGCIIERDGRVLMTKQAKQKYYGKWDFPAGHVEEYESIMDAAVRETFEETGCRIRLIGALPICTVFLENGETLFIMRFLAELISEDIKFDTSEILDVQWIDIDALKNMGEDEVRGHDIAMKTLIDLEENNVYPLEIYDDRIYKGDK